MSRPTPRREAGRASFGGNTNRVVSDRVVLVLLTILQKLVWGSFVKFDTKIYFMN